MVKSLMDSKGFKGFGRLYPQMSLICKLMGLAKKNMWQFLEIQTVILSAPDLELLFPLIHSRNYIVKEISDWEKQHTYGNNIVRKQKQNTQ